MFQLQSIDHVAINALDPAQSVRWYSRVLGLTPAQPPEWKPYPIFMLSGNFGVAIFKRQAEGNSKSTVGHKERVDHFAFRVSQSGFALAQEHLTKLNIRFTIKDHIYFHSLYCSDPDGNTVELTTFIKNFPPTDR